MNGTSVTPTGDISRSLPQAGLDTAVSGPFRIGRYDEQFVLSLVRKQHLLADEGSYFVFNNSGAGIATVAAPTAFSDTAPLFTLHNTDAKGNPLAKRIYLDWMRITQTAVGTAGTDLRLRGIVDDTQPTGGTVLTPVNVNGDVAKGDAIGVPRILPVGIAQTGNSRILIGTLQAIPTKTAPMTALDEVFLNFGGVEAAYPNYNVAASANVHKLAWPVPPVIIGPQQSFSLQFLITAQSAASSWTVEGGYWVR